MKRKEEEPTVDDNMYYGDDYYDKEEYTAVVDTNDYYQYWAKYVDFYDCIIIIISLSGKYVREVK